MDLKSERNNNLLNESLLVESDKVKDIIIFYIKFRNKNSKI